MSTARWNPSPDEAERMRRFLDRHMRVFDRRVPTSLLQMDVWAENILADERGRLTGQIDWDRSLRGDWEIEFDVLDYCWISEPAFWEGYDVERDRSPEAEVRLVFYPHFEVQKYIVIRRVRHRSTERDPLRLPRSRSGGIGSPKGTTRSTVAPCRRRT